MEGFTMVGNIDPISHIQNQKEELLKRLAEENGDQATDNLNTDDGAAQGEDGNGDAVNTEGNTDDNTQGQNKEDDQEAEKWKSRFLVLQGKYDSEVPRMAQEIRELKAEITTLTERQQNADSGAANTATANTLSDDVLAELEDRLGPELLDAFLKIADSRVDSSVSERMAKIEKQVEQVSTETAQQKAQNAFEDALTRDCANWRDLNVDENFNLHIRNTVEPYSGESLFDLLNEAYQQGDAAKVARLFNSYQPTQQSNTDDHTNQRQKELERMATPVRKGGGVNTQIDNNRGQVMTMADYEQLHRDYAGRYDHPDFVKKKAEFRAAAAEGRLV